MLPARRLPVGAGTESLPVRQLIVSVQSETVPSHDRPGRRAVHRNPEGVATYRQLLLEIRASLVRTKPVAATPRKPRSGGLSSFRPAATAQVEPRARARSATGHQPSVPDGPLKGPIRPAVIQPPVEVALLRLHALLADPCGIHAARIEGDVVAQRFVSGRRVAVGPADSVDAPAADDRVEVVRDSFELTPCRSSAGRSQQLGPDVVGRDIDGGRVTGLQHTKRAD